MHVEDRAVQPDVAVPTSYRSSGEDTVAAKFVLKKGSTGNYQFNLVATNGQVIATSESSESNPARSSASKR